VATKTMAAVTETAVILVGHSPKSVSARMTSVEQWGSRPIGCETADALLSLLAAPQPGTFYSSDDIDKVDYSIEYTSKLLQTKIFYMIPLVLAEQSCSELVRQLHEYQQDSALKEEQGHYLPDRSCHACVGDHLLLDALVRLHLMPIDGALLAADQTVRDFCYARKSFSSTLLENSLTRYPEDEGACAHLLV
jgi:hypothetical protein